MALATATSFAAQATTVNFEDQTENWNLSTFTSGGFNFVTSNVFGADYLGSNQYCGPACPLSGSTELLMPYGPASVTMSAAAGTTFSLNSFLAAGSFNMGNTLVPTTVTITGLLASGGTVTQSFGLATSGAQTLPFTLETANASFVDLTSVTFASSGASTDIFSGLTLDDIVVNATATSAVPETSSTALMLAGLGLFGFAARRRQRRG